MLIPTSPVTTTTPTTTPTTITTSPMSMTTSYDTTTATTTPTKQWCISYAVCARWYCYNTESIGSDTRSPTCDQYDAMPIVRLPTER